MIAVLGYKCFRVALKQQKLNDIPGVCLLFKLNMEQGLATMNTV